MENSGSTPAFTVETFVQTFGTFEDEVLLDKNDWLQGYHDSS